MECNISIKLPHPDLFPENVGNMGEEQREQHLRITKESYQGFWDI